MLNFELCDLMVLLDGKHKADFEELDDAQAYGYLRVDCGYAEVCDVVNRWTGEVMYHCEAHTERKVVEGFDYDE
jgi:hypothetical protein